MQPFTRRYKSDKQASAMPRRGNMSGAVIRLAAVFACAGTIQVLAVWFLR